MAAAVAGPANSSNFSTATRENCCSRHPRDGPGKNLCERARLTGGRAFVIRRWNGTMFEFCQMVKPCRSMERELVIGVFVLSDGTLPLPDSSFLFIDFPFHNPLFTVTSDIIFPIQKDQGIASIWCPLQDAHSVVARERARETSYERSKRIWRGHGYNRILC